MISYKLIKSNRKSISLSIDDTLTPVVRAPYYARKNEIERFVTKNEEWIISATEKKRAQLEKYNLSQAELNKLKEKARTLLPDKVKYYSNLMGLTPTGVKITSAKKRFGSCNGKNSLCFSCYLMLYPDEAIDYVVVHELAHIKHHNHSREFYNLISQYLPDYKQREKLLKKY